MIERHVVTGKSFIADSISLFNAVNNKSKVTVFQMPTAKIKNQILEKGIKELLDNVQSLPGIFKAHFKNNKGLSSSGQTETK